MSMGITDLLKEGTKHLTNETTVQNIEAVKHLSQIVRTSYGPNGMNKMIVNHLQKLFVTSDAATIIKQLEIGHPAAKIAVLSSEMQEQEIGDGTNYVLVFCGELLQNAQVLLESGLHANDIIAGYTKAATKAFEVLDSLKIAQVDDLRNVDQVAKFLRSAVAAKQYGYEDFLTPIIARACVDVCPKNPQHFNVDNVRVAKILGGGVLDTQVIQGHVLVRDADSTTKHVKDAKIVAFSAGFDIPKPETKDIVKITSAEELVNYNKGEEKKIEEIVKKISESGVNVVVSGGAIGEMALHFLERYKIMAIRVPSKFEFRRICKAVNAAALVRLGAPTAEEVGHCDYISVDEVGNTKVTIFKQQGTESRSGISTIVIRASTQNTLDDFERSIDDGVNVYKALAKDARFVAGAGAAEIQLSRAIRNYAKETPGMTQYAISKFGEAFEVIPCTLAENAGQKPIDVISNLHASHSAGNTTFGINVEEGSIESAIKMGIYDLLITKQSAIRLATHAAITILSVDQIIMSKPAGGPKPPKMGPMDADD